MAEHPVSGPVGAPTTGAAPPPDEHPGADSLVTLGIVGLFIPILAPIAWAKARRTLAEVDAQPGRFSNRPAINRALILGIIGTVLLALAVVWVAVAVIYVALGIADGTFDTG